MPQHVVYIGDRMIVRSIESIHLKHNTMKGNESKKETKKEKKDKKDSSSVKVQSDYQKEKSRKSIADPIVFKPRK